MEGRKKRRLSRVDADSCVACGCCVKVCPRAAISVFRGIYAKVDETLCVGCGKCARECPASVIEMGETER